MCIVSVPILPCSLDEQYHSLWLNLRNQFGNNLALVFSHVHEVLLGPGKLINGSQHLLRIAANLLDVWFAVDKVQELEFTAIVKENFLLLGVGLALVKFCHCSVSCGVFEVYEFRVFS